jgi:hypothetical protein
MAGSMTGYASAGWEGKARILFFLADYTTEQRLPLRRLRTEETTSIHPALQACSAWESDQPSTATPFCKCSRRRRKQTRMIATCIPWPPYITRHAYVHAHCPPVPIARNMGLLLPRKYRRCRNASALSVAWAAILIERLVGEGFSVLYTLPHVQQLSSRGVHSRGRACTDSRLIPQITAMRSSRARASPAPSRRAS